MENRLWYLEEATNFGEALPLGNGTIGAMVYGKGNTEKISLNHDELWSGMPSCYTRRGAYEVYKEAQKAILEGDKKRCEWLIENGFNGMYTDLYVPLGDLFIEGLQEKKDGYMRELLFEQGYAHVKNGGTERFYYVSEKEKALFVTLKGETNFQISLKIPHPTSTKVSKDILFYQSRCPAYMLSEGQNILQQKIASYEGDSIHFGTAIKVVSDGKVEVTNEGILVKDASLSTIIVHVDTSFIDFMTFPDKEYEKPMLRHMRELGKKDMKVVFEEHKHYFASMYNRVKLDIPFPEPAYDTKERILHPDDGLVPLLFNYGRYLIIAASAPNSHATNLQGIWNDQYFGPWNCGYTSNINLEMNYWPVLMCSLPEFYKPLIHHIENLCVTGQKTAHDYYHAPGFVVHHNTDIWAHSTAVGDRNKSSARWGFWYMASGWLCEHIFSYYEYTEDTDYLRDVGYPIMKLAAEFYLHELVPYEDRLILTPATSPENRYVENGEIYQIAKYTTMNQTILQELFKNLLTAMDVLKIDDEEFKTKLTEVLPKLKPFSIGKDGRLLEWDAEYEDDDVHHRHVSHLYGLYPGSEITTEKTPDLANACKQSLLVRGDDATGWSLGWKANLWAKLKDGDHALNVLRRQLQYVPYTETITMHGGTFANLFDAHPPFQIDGNYGSTAAIAQFFMQYENGKIMVLPALPSVMPTGSIEGLTAPGNIRVSIKWADGQLEKVELESQTDKTVTIQYHGVDKIVELKGKEKTSIVF